MLTRVLREGGVIAGIVAGVIAGLVLARIVGAYVPDVRIPGLVPIAGAAVILVAAAILASLMPAARASRVDVIKALSDRLSRRDRGLQAVASAFRRKRRSVENRQDTLD